MILNSWIKLTWFDPDSDGHPVPFTDADSGLDLGATSTVGYSVNERLLEDDLDDDDAVSLEGEVAFRRAMTKYGLDIDLSDDETWQTNST